MSRYERKLEALHAAQQEITKVHISQDLGHIVDELEKLFTLLRTRCRSMAGKIQQKLQKVDKQTQAALAVDCAIDARCVFVLDINSFSFLVCIYECRNI